VAYTGILPDLFKEGKGAVVQVKTNAGGEYIATEVLAKHDENYMPPEAKDALDKAQKTKDAKTL
jgi:cytochrome c-type biogenesis protein CcmE